MYKRKRYKTELTVIYIVSALMAVSIISLGVKFLTIGKAVNSAIPYESLIVENVPEIVVPEQKTVYFTFDDGPSRNTEKILDVLAAENVKATFFVCAQQCDDVDAAAVLRRILSEGHEIGLHSCTHEYKKVYGSLEGYLDDLNKINEYVVNATGYRPNILRFPGGSSTSKAKRGTMQEIIKEMTERGYRYYDWDVESGDQTSKVKSAEYLAERIIKGTKNQKTGEDKRRAIVLLHDSPSPKTSAEAVKLAIPVLRERGYAFDKLTASVDPSPNFN